MYEGSVTLCCDLLLEFLGNDNYHVKFEMWQQKWAILLHFLLFHLLKPVQMELLVVSLKTMQWNRWNLNNIVAKRKNQEKQGFGQSCNSQFCLGGFPMDWKIRVIVNNNSDTNCKNLACSTASLHHRSACICVRKVDVTYDTLFYFFQHWLWNILASV